MRKGWSDKAREKSAESRRHMVPVNKAGKTRAESFNANRARERVATEAWKSVKPGTITKFKIPKGVNVEAAKRAQTEYDKRKAK